jgi:hypothetical protein
MLLLGPTGVDKATAAENLRLFIENSHGQTFRYIDFENDFLKPILPPPGSWTNFLASDARFQATFWRQAWRALASTLREGEATVLSLHATYVSGALGLRCPLDIPSICKDFSPTLIVSLIDDVQAMWRRTETRAEGQPARGRPTLEQLISARRAEQILGDVILSHCSGSVRHVLCASANSLDALSNMLIFDARLTYLSFPISAPREMSEQGDKTFIDLINDAHRYSIDEMRRNHNRAFVSPLAIDELPLLSLLKQVDFSAGSCSDIIKAESSGDIEFDCSADRWPVQDLWGEAANPIVPSLQGSTRYPKDEIADASGMIRTDVGWRDRRLVLQSHSLAIICPKPPAEDRITRGVEEEIVTAISQGIVCNYWQKSEWDDTDFVGKRYPGPGSMGLGKTQMMVRRCDSLEGLIGAGI